jgi:nitroreductase
VDVAEAIRTKRAIRQFAPDALSGDSIRRILNAARRAQSSKNTQPWSFIVVRDKSRLAELSRLGTYASHLAGAAMAIVLASPDPTTKPSILFDLGQAAAYMQLAAWELGIASCLATIYEAEKSAALLGLPADRQIHFALSFGRPQEPAPPPSGSRPRGRRPLEDSVHWERWKGVA